MRCIIIRQEDTCYLVFNLNFSAIGLFQSFLLFDPPPKYYTLSELLNCYLTEI